jgi:hypothetical protein
MYLPKKICLSCRHFSLQDVDSGTCKVVKGLADYPVKAVGDTCDQWRDCGQHYFIRTGWIKGRLAREKGEKVVTETGVIWEAGK